MLTVRVPASTSNLGAGFDTFGLALELYLEVSAEPREGARSCEVESTGEGAGEVPGGEENLICRGYRLAAERAGVDAPPALFRAHSEIPVGRGLGSSAAAAVAGASLFESMTGHTLSPDDMLAVGYAIEGHCDNFAPSLVGGFVTACAPTRGGGAVVVRRDWPEELRVVAVVPDARLSTSDARRVLPPSVPREDAVFNVQRAALFHAALAERRWDLLGEAMRDRLHQPYRASLLPGFEEIFAMEPGGPLVGVALSGAGSAVLALAIDDPEAAGARVAAAFARSGIRCDVRVLGVDAVGRRLVEGGRP